MLPIGSALAPDEKPQVIVTNLPTVREKPTYTNMRVNKSLHESIFVEFNDHIITSIYGTPLPFLERRMLVRQCVIDMCAEFIALMETKEESHCRVHVVIESTPHTGSTTSLLYFLLQVSRHASLNVQHMILDTQERIVFLTRRKANNQDKWMETLITPDTMHLLHVLPSPSARTVYFFDASAGRTCPCKHAFDTVAFSTPSLQRSVEAFKLRGYAQTRYLPVWTLLEAMACRHYCFSHMAASEVQELFDMCGGVPLYLFRLNSDVLPEVHLHRVKTSLLNCLSAFTQEEWTGLLRAVSAGSKYFPAALPEHKLPALYPLLHCKVYTGDDLDSTTHMPMKYKQYDLVFGSRYILDQLIHRFYGGSAQSMYAVLI